MTLNEHIVQFKTVLTSMLTSDNVDGDKSERQMYKTIENISKDYGEEGISEFSKLFDIKEHNIGVYAARYLIVAVQLSKSVRSKALTVIDEYAKGGAVNADFFQGLLDVWRANHMNEKEYKTRKQIFIKWSIYYIVAMLIAVALGPQIERLIQIEKVDYFFIDFLLINLVSALYYYVLERKLKKGITEAILLTSLSTSATFLGVIIVIFPFTYFNVIQDPVQSGILLSFTFVVSIIIGLYVAWRLWLRNSWAGRKLPHFEND